MVGGLVLIFHKNLVQDCNLGQNKMRNRSTPHPNPTMYSRYDENTPFSHHYNGGRAGLNFSSILSKTVEGKFSVENVRLED